MSAMYLGMSESFEVDGCIVQGYFIEKTPSVKKCHGNWQGLTGKFVQFPIHFLTPKKEVYLIRVEILLYQ